MTIKDAINRNILPNLSEENYIKICGELGIVITSIENDKLNNEQLNRLAHDNRIIALMNKTRFIKNNAKFEKQYQEVVDAADKIVSDLEGTSVDDAKEVAEKFQQEATQGKQSYEDDVLHYSSVKTDLGLDPSTLNRGQQNRMNNYNQKMEITSGKLKKEYEKLDKLRNQKFKTAYKTARNQRRIERQMERISKLQAKQGVIASKQHKILNAVNEKYRAKKESEIRRFREEQNKIQEYAKEKIRLNNAKEAHTSDLEATEQEIQELEGKTGLKNAIDKFRLKHDRRVLSKDLKKIEKQEKKTESVFKKYQNKQNLMKAIREKGIVVALSQQLQRPVARGLVA
jgi:hypothetical protein